LSGFVGILNLDGAPVDRILLERLTRSLEFRGPDATGIWCDGAIGLGHTLLRTTPKATPDVAPDKHADTQGDAEPDAENDKQPATLGDRLWIVGDARIDARAELIAKLKANGGAARALSLSTSDAQLILLAYDAWGDACAEHLLGDFSFAIWDAPRRRLFCARDQFGVKPFFYSHLGSLVVFSNTLDCIRQHPAVSSRLNDLAITDFLLFDMNQDPLTTSFLDVQRLPAAHFLTCEQQKISIRRYWDLSVTTPVHYSRDAEYVERFVELLDIAVADRLRAQNIAVQMSGGLDSPTVAASARRVMARNGGACGLRAYTEAFDSLLPHQERHYAGLVADALKIPIEFLVSDHWKIFERADQPEYRTPEPSHSPFPDSSVDQLRQIAVNSRVALTGFGGDPALCGRITVHFRQLIAKKAFGRALADARRFFAVEGRFSRLYLRTRWRILFASKSQAPAYPEWLNEDLEKRLGLRDRWESRSNLSKPMEAFRPEAQQAMTDSMWPYLFEACDTGNTRVPVEIRHPIFDLRLVNFLLALPRLPWCSDKELLRAAARGVLPDAVRLRRKSPMPADPLVAVLQRPDSAWVDRFESTPELEQYAVRSRIPAVHRDRDVWSAWIHLRPLSLNYWLRWHLE
jgi:asparagine synthase (glutamine-hydrolysing)